MPVFLLLLVAMIVEITVLVLVGQAIGLLPTIVLLIVASVLGMWLLRREGTRAFAAFTQALRTRRVPHREVADGVLIAAAGVLIVVPGFVSDLIALFLLFPPTRAILSRRITRRAVPPGARGFVVDSVVLGPDSDELDRPR